MTTWQCPGCQIQIEFGAHDTSKCAVSHNCLRTRAVLTLCQNLHSSHSNVFSWRTYAFLDNTSLFYSCSFIDAVFADLRAPIRGSGTYAVCDDFFLVFFGMSFGLTGRRHLRRPLCLCAWTQQYVSFHPLWSLCLMFLLRMRGSATRNRVL